MRNMEVFKKHLREKRAVKIISGINNFDLEKVKQVAIAAQSGLASAVDVAASADVVKVAKQHTKLAVFASSIHPFKLLEAVKAGADAIEIGNFEALYKEGIYLSADDIYEITVEAMDLTQKYDPFVCVTIPGHIDVEEQIKLAQKLEILGVDLLQTEGVSKVYDRGAKGLLDAAKATIGNTLELSQQVGIPIMSASGLTPQTVPLAFAAGASAVGVGSCVNRLDTQVGMIAMVRNIVGSIAYNRQASREIEKASKNMEYSSIIF